MKFQRARTRRGFTPCFFYFLAGFFFYRLNSYLRALARELISALTWNEIDEELFSLPVYHNYFFADVDQVGGKISPDEDKDVS